jgi:hypothetical protein
MLMGARFNSGRYIILSTGRISKTVARQEPNPDDGREYLRRSFWWSVRGISGKNSEFPRAATPGVKKTYV